MRPVKRIPTNKSSSSSEFRQNTRKTKAVNMRGAPMRGGIRL